jgi:hypothetical protein
MAKTPNDAESATIRLTLSRQSVDLLEQLASRGIYGRNAAEVAARMVDGALQAHVEVPKLRMSEGLK